MNRQHSARLRRNRDRRQKAESAESAELTPPPIKAYKSPGLWTKVKILKEANSTRKTIMKDKSRIFSRKFLITVGLDVLVLLLTRVGFNEDLAVDLVKWITATYLVAQGGTDAAEAYAKNKKPSPIIAAPVPPKPAQPTPDPA